MKTYLCFDASNVLQRTFYAGWQANGDKKQLASLALHSALMTLNKYFNKYKPNKVVCAFDRPNWRKEYTKSDLCLSGQLYKGNRRQGMTPTERMRYEEFMEHIARFEEILREHTSMVVLARDMLEADDLLAGMAERFQDDRVIVISADKDLIQLLRFPNTLLIDPTTDKPRECEDIEWFMFLKCIRGDRGDNVRSAFPRVKETRIRAAFQDEVERLNLMHEQWTDERQVVNTVGDLYKENRLLMDLYAQPQPVKDMIATTIEQGFEQCGKYSHFHFLKFCNKHDLIKIREKIGDYAKMLST